MPLLSQAKAPKSFFIMNLSVILVVSSFDGVARQL